MNRDLNDVRLRRSSGFVTVGKLLLVLCLFGAYTGYKGGWVDVIALRVSEIFMSFPQIILVLLLVSITGQSLLNLINNRESEPRIAYADILNLYDLNAFAMKKARPRDDLLYSAKELDAINLLRRHAMGIPPKQAIEEMLKLLDKWPTNEKLLKNIA